MGLLKSLAMEFEDSGLRAAKRLGAQHGLSHTAVETLLRKGPYEALRAAESDSGGNGDADPQNPLGLTGSDLVAVGWETRDGRTWEHPEHGNGFTFAQVAAFEADRACR